MIMSPYEEESMLSNAISFRHSSRRLLRLYVQLNQMRRRSL